MSEDGGWLKLHRKAMGSVVFSDASLWHCWTACLMLASFERRQFQSLRQPEPIVLEPGQFITGRYELAAVLYGPRKAKSKAMTAWRTLGKLEKLNKIRVKSEHHFSIVTICNWSTYQKVANEVVHQPVISVSTTCAPLEHFLKNGENEKNGLEKQPAQPVEKIRYKPDPHQGEFEQALARWKGSGGTQLSMSEWEIFRRMLMGFGDCLNIAGQDQSVYAVATRAASEAIKQQAGFGTASSASKYIAAILERCRRDGVWPGEFAETKPQKKLTPQDVRDAIAAGKITMMDGKPLPAGEWGFNETGLFHNRKMHTPAAEINKRKFT
jgi:hypothetical protein